MSVPLVQIQRVCVVIYYEEQDDFTVSPRLAEMWAMVGKRGNPLYQMVVHDLTKAGQPTLDTPLWTKPVYEGDLYMTPLYASLDFYGKTDYWINDEEYRGAVGSLSGRTEKHGEGKGG